MKKLYWSITDICNLQCRYCYYNSGLEQKYLHSVTKEDFDKTVDGLCSVFDEFILTGGEVLSHPYIFDFIRRLKNNGKTVGILTNGVLLTSQRCKELIELEVDSVAISLDSLDESINDHLRGQTSKVLEAIKTIISLGGSKVGLEIMMTVSRHNISSIPALLDFCRGHKINLWLDPIEINSSCKKPDLVALDLEKLSYDEFNQLSQYFSEWAGDDETLKDYVLSCQALIKKKHPVNISCPMGTSSFVLDPDFFLYPCFLRKDLPLGNILKESPLDLIDKFKSHPQIRSLRSASCVRLGCVCMTIANNYKPYV